jgi:hypothetical protein
MVYSVLFPSTSLHPDLTGSFDKKSSNSFYTDLNLKTIFDDVTLHKTEYDLKPYFYYEPHDLQTLRFRQEIFRDLERPEVFAVLKNWEVQRRNFREALAKRGKLRYEFQKQAWLLKATHLYVQSVETLLSGWQDVQLQAVGLQEFLSRLESYVRGEEFTSLSSEVLKLMGSLASISYEVHILGNTVQVRRFSGGEDLSHEVEKAFEKFRQGAVADHSLELFESNEMNQVEAQIFECVAKLWPEIFQDLASFCERRASFQDELIVQFEREIQFYVAYLDYIRPLKDTGLSFCYPQVVALPEHPTDRFLYQTEAFDLALAKKLCLYGQKAVKNDFYLSASERILVVNGPNQGGKTTFARSFGQAHYLGNLGCPVPGTQAQLLFYDQLFTHFEKEENLQDQHGKLYDDLVRMHEIVTQLTGQSLFVFNEIFNSTTVLDSLELARRVFAQISEVDTVGVCVTFLDELADFNEKTVSMMSTVNPEDPATRTFKVIRKPADGLAFALAIAEKYNLTYHKILARIPS